MLPPLCSGKPVKMLDKNNQQLIGTTCHRNWDKLLLKESLGESAYLIWFFFGAIAPECFIYVINLKQSCSNKVVNFKLVSVVLMDLFLS